MIVSRRRRIAASTRKELGAVRTFLAWCRERKWIADNPARRLRMPRAEELIAVPFEAAEVSRLLGAAGQIATTRIKPSTSDSEARALVLTLLYSGRRISDVTRLRRAALDDQSGHLTLKVLKTGVALKVLVHQDAIDACGCVRRSAPNITSGPAAATP